MPLLVYSVLRLLLFVVALGALWLLQMRGWLLVLVAAVLALMLSYLLLRRPREAAARYLADRAEHRARTGERFSREIEDDAATEDAVVDAAERTSSERETDAQQDTVGELEEPRPRQHRDQ
ncbi:DUF4229 domain-containing protein [Cellulosimicrobium terreum]|nr:DUF4229 domain-containing protein [Cellulosimicrobium terreum]